MGDPIFVESDGTWDLHKFMLYIHEQDRIRTSFLPEANDVIEYHEREEEREKGRGTYIRYNMIEEIDEFDDALATTGNFGFDKSDATNMSAPYKYLLASIYAILNVPKIAKLINNISGFPNISKCDKNTKYVLKMIRNLNILGTADGRPDAPCLIKLSKIDELVSVIGEHNIKTPEKCIETLLKTVHNATLCAASVRDKALSRLENWENIANNNWNEYIKNNYSLRTALFGIYKFRPIDKKINNYSTEILHSLSVNNPPNDVHHNAGDLIRMNYISRKLDDESDGVFLNLPEYLLITIHKDDLSTITGRKTDELSKLFQEFNPGNLVHLKYKDYAKKYKYVPVAVNFDVMTVTWRDDKMYVCSVFGKRKILDSSTINSDHTRYMIYEKQRLS